MDDVIAEEIKKMSLRVLSIVNFECLRVNLKDS